MLTKDNFAQAANLTLLTLLQSLQLLRKCILDHEAIMAALLHDVIEDTPIPNPN